VKRAWWLAPLLLLFGCSAPATPSPVASVAPGSSFAGTPIATTAVGPTPPASSAQGTGLLAIDESLLRYLPAAIGPISIAYSAEATQAVLRDAVLAQNATALAYGIAVDPATNDLVVAAVVRLRPGVFNDAFYRSWRTTYDRAACAQAGGVAGIAETTIAGRTVFIGSCNGGAHTYHAYLELPGIMISATSVGAKRFGEQLVSNLRP
jgi:hypothetical protein